MKADTDAAAAKVAENWPKSTDRSECRFKDLLNSAAKGTGVTDKNDLRRIWAEIRRKALARGVVPNGYSQRRA